MNGSLFYRFILLLQNSWLTSWIWQHWQHDETGRVTMLPFWRSPGRRWYRCKWRG